ncbi:MAG: NYN domain-containing protein [Acidobacteria bacterium]|nr:NYN domain-containing protein [Acidobacteriota bacterium]
MSYLIDGNNLMGRTRGIDRQAPDARLQVLRRLAAFRNLPGQRPRRITVVFDGAPEPNFPDGSTFQGVHIFYAQPNSTADALIKRRADQQKDKRALTVVTSDRALYNYVRASGVQALTCEQFNHRLQAALEAAGIEEKADVQLDTGELHEWMRYFGVEEEQNQ